MTITTGKHFVVFPMQMWGHTRTMCTLVARMAKLRNVTITFFIISGFYDRVMAEISREFLPGEEYLSARIRVVALQHNKSVAITKDVEAAFEAAYVKMCNGEPLTCAKTGKEIPVHPVRVSVAIIDMFIPDAFEAVRKHTPDTVKVFVWVPVATHSFFFYWAEDHVDSVEASAAQRGISFEEAAREGRDYNESCPALARRVTLCSPRHPRCRPLPPFLPLCRRSCSPDSPECRPSFLHAPFPPLPTAALSATSRRPPDPLSPPRCRAHSLIRTRPALSRHLSSAGHVHIALVPPRLSSPAAVPINLGGHSHHWWRSVSTCAVSTPASLPMRIGPYKLMRTLPLPLAYSSSLCYLSSPTLRSEKRCHGTVMRRSDPG